ncbi:MAG: hypothetical protein QOJ90_2241 [Actinomycetota bacterium]|nr:hypothetical protein [Actinomycetota bacterium]
MLGALRSAPSSALVTVRIAASNRRSQPALGDLLRNTAVATHCRIALAETTCITIRWIDGFVSGTVEDVTAFLTTVTPQLVRAHGQVSLATAA